MRKLEIIESWINSLDESLPPATKKTYKNNVKVFFDSLPEGTILITELDFSAFKDDLIKKGCTNNTRHNYISILKRFSPWYGCNGGNDFANPITDIKRDDKVTETLTMKQYKRVISAAKNLRDRLIIIFMGYYGLSPKDITELTWGEVHSGEMYPKYEKKINEYISQRSNISYSNLFFVSVSNNNQNGQLTTNSISYLCKEIFRRIGLDDQHITANSISLTYNKIKAAKEVFPDL